LSPTFAGSHIGDYPCFNTRDPQAEIPDLETFSIKANYFTSQNTSAQRRLLRRTVFCSRQLHFGYSPSGSTDIISTANESTRELQLIDKEPPVRLLLVLWMAQKMTKSCALRHLVWEWLCRKVKAIFCHVTELASPSDTSTSTYEEVLARSLICRLHRDCALAFSVF